MEWTLGNWFLTLCGGFLMGYSTRLMIEAFRQYKESRERLETLHAELDKLIGGKE